jgi:hypothetical protein
MDEIIIIILIFLGGLILGMLLMNIINFIPIAEMWKKLFNARYIKMWLVREGIIIGTYIIGIKNTGWIIDKNIKMAWKIPKEGEMFRRGKHLFFFATLESIENFKFEKIDELWKEKEEISIPLFRPKFTEKEWTIEKTSVVIRKGSKEKIVNKVGTSYKAKLPMLDIPALFQYLEGDTIRMIAASAKQKKNDEWLKWLIIIGAIIVVIWLILKGGH